MMVWASRYDSTLQHYKKCAIICFLRRNTDLDFDTPIHFQRQALRVEIQLSENKIATCEFQKQSQTLAECRSTVDFLIEADKM